LLGSVEELLDAMGELMVGDRFDTRNHASSGSIVPATRSATFLHHFPHQSGANVWRHVIAREINGSKFQSFRSSFPVPKQAVAGSSPVARSAK
jgi:hypothetical protein